MLDLTSHLLRAYFAATDWHPYNSYLHLTSSSSSILLDFPIPTGLSFSISSCPSPIFYSTHRLRALPTLAGSLGYVFASTDKPLRLDGSSEGPASSGATKDAQLRDVLDRFRIVTVPSTPSGKEEIWQGGQNIAKRDYLLYGCIHAPTARLDALYTTRLSPTWNFILTACSFPPRTSPAYQPAHTSGAVGASGGEQIVQPQGPTAPGATNLQVTVQQDTGKWFNEFSYSVDDALWGFRTMHHFGSSKREAQSSSPSTAASSTTLRPLLPGVLQSNDDDSAGSSEAGGGLKGRFSAGAELFFSAEEKSAGLSTGVRFTTLPESGEEECSAAGVISALGSDDAAPPLASPTAASTAVAIPSQPPTTITATLNPMMGHLSSAYAAQIGRDVVACSRYDFNVYSYESQLTIGGEYWLRSSSQKSTGGSSWTENEPQERKLVAAPAAGMSRQRSSTTESGSLSPPPQVQLDTHTGEKAGGAASSVNLSKGARTPGNSPSLIPPTNDQAPGRPEVVASDRQPTVVDADQPKKGQAFDKDVVLPRLEPGQTLPPTPSRGAATQVSQPRIEEHEPLGSSSRKATPQDVANTIATSGLLKWSLSSSLLLSLLWQGRLRNCIVSVGIRADLSGGGSGGGDGQGSKSSGGAGGRMPGGVGSVINGIGMDIVYWGGSGSGSSDATGTGGESDETPKVNIRL
ncbi:unnamed protein product [Parajaminaea phylloscopi]